MSMTSKRSRAPFTSGVHSAVLAGFGSGFGAAACQILILRETLSLFASFEPALGPAMAAWLLWTGAGAVAARFLGRRLLPASPATIVLLLLALGAACCLSLLMILAAPLAPAPLWTVPAGEFPGVGEVLLLPLAFTAPTCLVAGALFTTSWTMARAHSASPLFVYTAEAAGAAAGGLFLRFAAIPLLPGLPAAGLVALVLALLGWGVLHTAGKRQSTLRLLPPMGTLAFLGFILIAPALEHGCLDARFGPGFVARTWTPSSSLVLVERRGLYTLFTDGLPSFSIPDPELSQMAAHVPALAVGRPGTVMATGGNPVELAKEFSKHPQAGPIIIANPDPGLIPFLLGHLPPRLTAPLRDKKVLVSTNDPVKILRVLAFTENRTGVILLETGDPVTMATGRLHTREFFELASKALVDDGVLSLSLESGPAAPGPAQAKGLVTELMTLEGLFDNVAILPGSRATFLASRNPLDNRLTPGSMMREKQVRSIEASYIREDSLADRMNIFARTALLKTLGSFAQSHDADSEVSTLLRPAAWRNGLLLWLRSLWPGGYPALTVLVEASPWTIRLGGVLFGLLTICWVLLPARTKAMRRSRAVYAMGLGAGGASMSLGVSLLLGFQAATGALAQSLGVVVAAQMAGLGAGSLLPLRWPRAPLAGLAASQALLCLALAAVPGLVPLGWSMDVNPTWLFILAGLAGGVLGGAQFGFATQILVNSAQGQGQSAHDPGPILYAVDLAGSALVAVIVPLFLIPACGFPAACTAAALAGSIPLATLPLFKD